MRKKPKLNRLNIAFGGGSCTGKSVTAAALYAHLKTNGMDYDLIGEEKRKLYPEFGNFRSPFERIYMWRQQEREELRSIALDGFITDSPLFQFYSQAAFYASESRDDLAIRELFRMCLEIKDRYQLIIIAKDPEELPYKKDTCRHGEREESLEKHRIIRTFVEHHYPGRLLLVEGNLQKRISIIEKRLREMGKIFTPLPY